MISRDPDQLGAGGLARAIFLAALSAYHDVAAHSTTAAEALLDLRIALHRDPDSTPDPQLVRRAARALADPAVVTAVIGRTQADAATVAAAEAVLAVHPRTAGAHHVLAAAAERAGDAAAVRIHLHAAVDADPDFDPAVAQRLLPVRVRSEVQEVLRYLLNRLAAPPRARAAHQGRRLPRPAPPLPQVR